MGLFELVLLLHDFLYLYSAVFLICQGKLQGLKNVVVHVNYVLLVFNSLSQDKNLVQTVTIVAKQNSCEGFVHGFQNVLKSVSGYLFQREFLFALGSLMQVVDSYEGFFQSSFELFNCLGNVCPDFLLDFVIYFRVEESLSFYLYFYHRENFVVLADLGKPCKLIGTLVDEVIRGQVFSYDKLALPRSHARVALFGLKNLLI